MITARMAVVGLWRGFAGAAILAGVLAASAYAARPKAAELLPEDTLGLVSITDTQELAQRFMNTSLGQMSQDPQMKPVVDELYGSMSELVASVKDFIGLSLPEIVNLPHGEVTFAYVAVKDADPAFVFLFDAGEQIANARLLLQRGVDAMVKEDDTKQELNVNDTKITVVNSPNNKTYAFFDKDGTIVGGNNIEAVKRILGIWNGEKGRVLSDNANYGTIMNRCRGSKDEPPQVVWFVDPINIMRSAAEQNVGLRVGVAMLPVLGLDGLSAIGGSMLYDTGQYDSVNHIHVLLENPRSGIIKMIALESGVSKPERWVPTDVASYMTVHVNFDTAVKTLTPMWDSLSGTWAFSAFVQQRFSTPLGVDVEKQILPALEGRVTYITWFEKPASQVSGVTLVAVKFKDTEALSKALDGLAKRLGEGISKQNSSGKDYYRVNIPVPQMPPGAEPPPMPIPCFGIMDDYFVFTNRPSLYEKVLSTLADGTKSLGEELEFKLIANKIQRQSGGSKPVMLGFSRPEEGLRYWYDIITADSTRDSLKKQAESNPFFKSLDSSLQKSPLPPFEVIQRYLAPGGSMAVDDASGLHFMSFTLRRKGNDNSGE
ncbi:MAG: hypothetical protein ABSG67_15400 [Thermoguttaceae bacterium]